MQQFDDCFRFCRSSVIILLVLLRPLLLTIAVLTARGL